MDTAALRGLALELRAVGNGAAEMGARGGSLAPLAAGVGEHGAAAACSGFLEAWTCGLRVLAHDVTELAGTAEGAAGAFEAIEAALAATARRGGAGCVPVATGASSTGVVPPVPQRHGWGALPTPGVAVQLSAATHPKQLVPGEPDDVEELGRRLREFAVNADEAAARLRKAGTGGWAGQAATVFAAQVDGVPAALDRSAEAFGMSGQALLAHAVVLADAQAQAGNVLRLWQDAAYRGQVARGVLTATTAIPAAALDAADADLARAAAMLAAARAEVEFSAQRLRATIVAATEPAPRDPGFWARLTAGIRSFGSGAGEGTADLVAGVAGILTLAAKLDPARAYADPHAYLDTLDSIADAAIQAGAHPIDTAKAAVDWDTWASDPARAAGRLLPEIAVALATAGAAGTAKVGGVHRGISTARQIDADAVAEIRRRIDSQRFEPGIAWTGEGGLTLDAQNNAIAEAFAARAAAAEPGITAFMEDLARRIDGDLLGLDEKLKEAGSFKRKLAEALKGRNGSDDTPDPFTVMANMKDTVRYTLRFDESDYTAGANRTLADLRGHGLEEVKMDNRWNGTGYQGINTAWREPTTGQVFEVQFHTDLSRRAATVDTHHWFEEQRLSSTTKGRWDELEDLQNEVFAQVPRPAGVDSVTGPAGVDPGRAQARGGAAGGALSYAAAASAATTDRCE